MSTTRNINKQLEDMRTPLEKHVQVFTDSEGDLTYDSIKDGMQSVGMSEDDAKKAANFISGIGATKLGGCPYSGIPASSVTKFVHPRDTGIYNADGTINEEMWSELTKLSEKVNGVEVITESSLLAFSKSRQDQDSRWDWLWLGQKAATGEWRDFFNLLTDSYKGTGENAERCVTKAGLRQFYEDSSKIFEKAQNHELPAPRPR